MDKYLIINADDFGMCFAHNEATLELFKCGGISSATVMMPCKAAAQAVDIAKNNPQFAVGVHLTTTSEWANYRWGPVLGKNVPSLADDDGYFYHESDEFANHASLEEAVNELVAQIEAMRALGYQPSHLDNHMGSMYGVATCRFELLMALISIAGKYKLPLRLPINITAKDLNNKMLDIKIPPDDIQSLLDNVKTIAKENDVALIDYLCPGDWNGPQRNSFKEYEDYMLTLISSFEPGVTETYIHPAVECDEIKSITKSWERRVWEYKLFSSPKLKQHIDSLGIKLISYRDLKEIKG